MGSSARRSVVVTGASSGIGRACALDLVRHGFRVFAGVRKNKDAAELRLQAGEPLVPVEIDVTKRTTIERARGVVATTLAGSGLDGLVNNAGIGTTAPVEFLTQEDLRQHFEVNVFGQVAVTQAFLPLIHRAVGRIVNIGSVGSHVTMPFGGALCASKSALQSLTDALRLELRPFGIHVSLVEPGAIATPGVDKTLGDIEAVIRALPEDGIVRYGEQLRTFARVGYSHESNGSPPELVATTVRHALTDRHPHVRYPVGKHAKTLEALARTVPDEFLDQLRLRMFGFPTAFGGKTHVEAHCSP
jgi:NAD(P)-dependent dehydrogenase (short-subunit alcohol dehydrogenase family)